VTVRRQLSERAYGFIGVIWSAGVGISGACFCRIKIFGTTQEVLYVRTYIHIYSENTKRMHDRTVVCCFGLLDASIAEDGVLADIHWAPLCGAVPDNVTLCQFEMSCDFAPTWSLCDSIGL
jgi:hypothetical protein